MEQRAELPFFFADRRTPVMLEPIFLPLLLILAAMILGFCLILPGIRGRERIFAALRFFMLGSAGFWIFFRLVFSCSKLVKLRHCDGIETSYTVVMRLCETLRPGSVISVTRRTASIRSFWRSNQSLPY